MSTPLICKHSLIKLRDTRLNFNEKNFQDVVFGDKKYGCAKSIKYTLDFKNSVLKKKNISFIMFILIIYLNDNILIYWVT